ncbi:MAG TPA: hypothetical protein ENH62_07485 [Marinobacter sp.]|uniref:Uncharacterized protein n=1 Tax=marine sediment metagenome TaxID=412755 RepID=A0A0F9QRQ6_9ZZZZ|nr:hypothetical protein [Marinobacter sp.]
MANAKKKNGTALAKIGDQEFAILKVGMAGMLESLRENIGDESLAPFELDRVKIPAGGTQAWTIPTVDGEIVAKDFTGVIVYHKLGRVYWRESIDDGGGNTPPDCCSDDNVTGIGEPGGECNKCPFAQFGSSNKGKGQACKQVKLLFVVRETALLPIVVSLPPTSLKPAKQYMLRLASNALPYYSVLTRFGLEKAINGSGVDYSRAVLSLAERLNPEQAAQFKKLSQELKPQLDAVRVDQENPASTEAG